jgi:hypothetical protein
MTVFNTDEPGWGSLRKPDTACTICGEQLRLLYVEWQGTNLFICAPCCRTIKNGLMADMVQAGSRRRPARPRLSRADPDSQQLGSRPRCRAGGAPDDGKIYVQEDGSMSAQRLCHRDRE